MQTQLNSAQSFEQFQSQNGAVRSTALPGTYEVGGAVLTFSVRNQSCPNTNCYHFGKLCAGNVTVHARQYQRFMCKSCNKTWVAHRNDVTYRLHATAQTLRAGLLLLQQGLSVRVIARSLGISPSTVQRWKSKTSLIHDYSLSCV